MRRGVRAWVNKAEADFRVALREARARKDRPHDAVCFHCQQAIEKYLKAILANAGLHVPRTHNLVLLWSLLPSAPVFAAAPDPAMARLTIAAVEYRYPGRSATARQSREAVRVMRDLRRLCRMGLGLPLR